MTSQTSRSSGWRRALASAVAGGALAAGLVVGSAPALAEPAAPTTEADAPAAPLPADMTAEQALAIIQSDYDTGAGGGQLSNLIHQVMELRSQGFYASNSNRKAIVAALEKRPNQAPLIAALQSTLAFQLKTKMRAASAAPQQQPATIGINQAPLGVPGQPGGDNGVWMGSPGGAINIPLGP